MDFTNRSSQNQPAFGAQNNGASSHSAAAASEKRGKSKGFTKGFGNGKWGRAGSIIFLVCMVILAAAAICLIAFSGNNDESQYVKKSQYQAVFLTNGQVYFGHIKNINSQYIDLESIYYLQQPQKNSGSSTANNNVTLVKLGCELHAPYDQMVIQARQVSFWENIQSSGQVAKGIAKLPKCVPSTPPASQSNATTPSSNGSSSNADNSTSSSNSSTNSADTSGSNSTNSSSSNTSNSSSSTPSSSTSTKPSTP